MSRRSLQVVRIGGLTLGFENRCQADLVGPFEAFGSHGRCASRLTVLDEPGQAASSQRPLCESGFWALFEHEGGLRYEAYARPLFGPTPLLQADLNADWTRGLLRVDPTCCPTQARLAPIASPFGELLLVALLNRHQGLYVHAACVTRNGAALLFLGKSGAGKTTLSTLSARDGAHVLSDDRTALRFQRGRLTAFGTPFHGTGRQWSAQSAPVRALFFLDHAPATETQMLSVAETAARLAALSFAPFWSRPGLDEVLRLCERAACAVPAYSLRFRPDASALEALDAATQAQRHLDHRVPAPPAAARGPAPRRTPAVARTRRLDAPGDPER
ncbi:MAG: hypothetical protein HY901_16090 [Deltaproteobacteria bacterium]|nr:hypothetical protein [Deltaproteobacteria bacterium]